MNSEWIFFLADFIFSLGIIFVSCSAFLLRENKNFLRYGLLLLVLCFYVLFAEFLFVMHVPFANVSYLNNNFMSSELFIFYKIFILFAAACCLILAYAYAKLHFFLHLEFVLVFLISVQGMLLMVSSNDLFITFLCVELQAFCFYILAGLKRSNVPAEVTMRYFIFGVLTGLIFLLGISLLYGCLGTTNFSEIAVLLPAIITNSSDNSLIAVSVILIFVGIFFKLGIVPFHLWMADVYEGSPLFLTAIFAILPKIPFVLLLLKFFFIFNSAIVFLNLYILFNFLGLISIVVGTFGALYEVKIKRLLAYAAITHMGYIVLCLSLDFWEGAVAITFYLIVYVLMTIYAFGLLIGLSYWTADGKLTYIGDLFKRGNTFASINLSVLFLSMAGVPPFAGFFPKWYMFQLLLQSDCYFLALFIVIMSVVSSVYYLRLFKILIFDSFELWGPSRQIGVFLVLLIGIGFLINVFFFLIQGNLIMFLFLIIGRFF